jgi:hypothetical protein
MKFKEFSKITFKYLEKCAVEMTFVFIEKNCKIIKKCAWILIEKKNNEKRTKN